MDWIAEARCFVDGQLTECCLGIDESTGTITHVKKVLTGAPIRRWPGHIVLPSAVDLHVHFRDPGFTRKEDFRTGTHAALLGGVGTVLDMPNTDPLVDTVERLEAKADEVRGKALVDWGLWATLSRRTQDPVALARHAEGIKLYMAPTTGVETTADDAAVGRALGAARQAGRVVAVHAEEPIAPDAANLKQHDAARPVEREVHAVRRVAGLAVAKDAVHLCHASSVEVAQTALDAGFTVGVTPHHLMLHIEPRWALTGKVNPPLRPRAVQESLMERFQAGAPYLVETDHAPHNAHEKDGPFAETPAGLPGIQTAYPVLLRMAKAGRFPLARLVAAYCERPSQRLGLGKGRLAPGHAADFVVVDPSRPQPIPRDWLVSKAGWSPYEGFEALIPTVHVLAGEVAVEDGVATRRPGRGRRITVPSAPSAASPARGA